MIITNLDKSSKIIITQNIYTVDTSYKNVSGHRRRCFWDPFVNWWAWYTCPQSFKTAGPAPIDYANASWTENYIPIIIYTKIGKGVNGSNRTNGR